MEETWMPIPNYEDYELSNLGRIRRGNLIFKLHTSTTGYLKIGLWKNGKLKNKFIHKLLVEMFMGITIDNRFTVIDHKDNNKLNNSLSNLQVITNRHNSIKDKNPKSGHSCIYRNSGSWLVRLRINGKKTSLGTFKNIEDAIMCRNAFFDTEKPIFKSIKPK